ncbi:MAG: cupin domain-containing protein [Candidatus Limnocylindria bacterium]
MSEREGRVFLRGITAEHYGLDEHRRRQLSAPRVRRAGTVTDDGSVGHSADSEASRTWWVLGPGDEPFLTQSLQVHFVELFPGGSNRGHGHQNEAIFYILEGRGYEIHDEKRYDWEKGDLVVVHNDSVHQHFNADPDRRALAMVVKAKAASMYLGLVQQGRGGPQDGAGYGPPEDWARLWTPGVEERKKVLKPTDGAWKDTPDGRIRDMSSRKRTDFRTHTVDVYQQEIPPGGRSGKHWHMADEALYVLSGRGHSLHWDVAADIGTRYRARVAKEPTRWDFAAGDLVYMPQNTVHQHHNDDPSEPLLVMSVQNRLFKLIGYDATVVLEPASGSPRADAVPAARR